MIFDLEGQSLVKAEDSYESVPTVNVRLWRADAVVLFDWLMSTDLDAVPITHPAQKQALADLLGRFEWACDVDITASTEEEIAEAQEAVAKDMGW
ncbi:hypothetical protein [Streptomyces sp. NBC_00316]|uniref:hypothetical protein n=1 Tax=Streptomyces sp. NBC_00316 TaxID=2975710 RepID=UPI002E2C7070|nr:hypothetical protein [Streptomyces sp. NBC_00316]